MADTDKPAPTFREERTAEALKYTCLIPDAREESGICGWIGPDLASMLQHMQNAHAGVMVIEEVPSVPPAEPAPGTPEDAPPPASEEPAADAPPSPESPPHEEETTS